MTASPDTLPGLTTAEVADRVRRGLTNKFQPRSSRTYKQIFFDNLINVFNITLFVLLIILLALGESGDTIFAGSTVLVNLLIGLVQEIRAKQALDKLAALSAGTVRVRRDGQPIDLAIDQVVQDDLIELTPGDKVVVDGPCVWEDSVEVDESLITGESDSIEKDAGDPFTSGSFVTAGRAIMRAEQIGEESFVNKLNRTAKGFKLIPTPIQQKINAIVAASVVGMIIFGPLRFVADIARGETLINTVRNTVVLVSTFVPQGLVLATTLALSFGAVRISLQKTLVQRINAIESMANVTVLCFDKTGTLTENRLSVTEIIPIGSRTLDEIRPMLARYIGQLATQNKTASAIEAFVGKSIDGPQKQSEIPFTSTRKWGALTFADGQTYLLGAPEMLIDDKSIHATSGSFAKQGLRVLAFAVSPAKPIGSELPADRSPVALIVVHDTPRADIRSTLAAFTARNVRLKVISGDNAETVTSIAQAAGLNVSRVVTGPELEALTGSAFQTAVRSADVFARIKPETKRQIISALGDAGEYVAMVGDGVNDVPALKAARLGIAMYDGAQIAKDVADLVLLNNALSTLPQALSEGHKTTQKIYATAKIFLTRNLYLILMFIMVGVIGLPFPGQVRQLSWAAISTSGIPALLIALEWVQPRAIWQFRRQVLGYILISGLIGAVTLTLAYATTYLTSGHDVALARTVMTLVAVIYGTFIFWDVNGVILFEPITFKQNRREAITGLLVGAVTLAVPFLLPRLFEIALIPTPYLIGISVLAILADFALWRSTLEQNNILAPFRSLVD
jgi:cation-transporting P-type ATPase E